MQRTRVTIVGVALLLVVGAACGDGGEASRSDAGRLDASGATTRSAREGTAACARATRRNVSYANSTDSPAAQTTLDVYPAPGACDADPGPVVVWVHGGGWSVGDKASVGTKLAAFHGLGAAVVSVNYRLAPRPAQGITTGVHHPDQAVDVAAAVAWSVEHATSFGADPDRVVLVGHSAGAHLVSLVGADPRYLEEAGVAVGTLRCVVALDTEGYDLAEKVALGGPSEALVRNAFGDDPAVWRDASPIVHAADTGGAVSFLVVTRGTPRRQREAVRFVDAVTGAGGDARLVRAPGYTHADVNRRLGASGETVVTPAVTEFVRECAAVPD